MRSETHIVTAARRSAGFVWVAKVSQLRLSIFRYVVTRNLTMQTASPLRQRPEMRPHRTQHVGAWAMCLSMSDVVDVYSNAMGCGSGISHRHLYYEAASLRRKECEGYED
jgi:hypothetical protein